jgi:hypothetical protein
MNFKSTALAAAALAFAGLPAFASQASFDRTLAVSGRVDLSVQTGSGNVHITAGSGNQIVIHGTVHSNWMGGEDRVREIAAHPPIEQTGNIVRIGAQNEHLNNVSIDYEIQAPADAFLEAHSGSGEITDDGVGENAKLDTGSGNVELSTGSAGFHLNAETGSGTVHSDREMTVQGSFDHHHIAGRIGGGGPDVEVHTGSGDIRIH